MANPQRSLFDSDDELQAYIARLMAEAPPGQRFGYQHDFRPGSPAVNSGMSAGLSARIQPGEGVDNFGRPVAAPGQVTPQANFNLGPLSLSGGLDLRQAINQDTGTPYTRATPNVGAALNLPVAGGDASLGFNLTEEQKQLLAAWGKKLQSGGEIGARAYYNQPRGDGGRPEWGVGFGGRIPFNGGLR